MDLEQVKKTGDQEGFITHNGIRFTVLEKGYCECQVDVGPDNVNLYGTAHGGMIFGLCDTAAGYAACATSRNVVTQSGNIHFLLPARPGTITAKARVIRAGRNVAYCETAVFDAKGAQLASASFDMFFVGDRS